MDALLESIDHIYAAASGDAPWDVALNALSDTCAMANTALVRVNPMLGEAGVITPRADPEVAAEYARYWWAHDPTVEPAAAVGVGEVFTLGTRDHERFLRSHFHRAYWTRSGLGARRLASNLSRAGGGFAAIVTHARAANDEISAQELGMFRAHLVHLVRAVNISTTLQNARLAQEAALARAHHSATFGVFVDAGGKVVAWQHAQDETMRRGNVMGLHHRRVVLRDGAANRRLSAMLHDCTSRLLAPRGGVVALRNADGTVCGRLHVIPRARGQGDAIAGVEPVALLLITDFALQEEERLVRLEASYGLTPAEARCAVALVAGGSRAELAQRLGISTGTVRTHLSRIFHKTNTTRQSELVALVLHGGGGET